MKARFAHESDPAVDEALLVEALVLHALKHPALLGLVGISTQVMPFLVATELMVNGDLKSYLRACRPSQPKPKAKLTLLDVSIIVEKIASALAYLESVSVIHRDVAARNVLVGERQTDVKLGDLGAARSVFREQAREYTATTDHKPARWMSLESLKTAKFSAKSDVWAFGVLCWEVTTLAKTPYGALGVKDMVDSLTNGDRLQEVSTNCNKLQFYYYCCLWPPLTHAGGVAALISVSFRSGSKPLYACLRAPFATMTSCCTKGTFHSAWALQADAVVLGN